MAKRHITARIEEDAAQALDQWAEEHGATKSVAVESLIRAGIAAQGDGSDEEAVGSTEAGSGSTEALEAYRAANADLRAALVDSRATVAALTAQLTVKDGQIARAHDLADQAQRLQAAQAQQQLIEASSATGNQSQRDGWRARLARWIEGGGE